jgi:hypothetical protein
MIVGEVYPFREKRAFPGWEVAIVSTEKVRVISQDHAIVICSLLAPSLTFLRLLAKIQELNEPNISEVIYGNCHLS